MPPARKHRIEATDQQLMTSVAGGDARAFEQIYDRYQRRAYSLALRITGSPGSAEEATQDAFLSVWREASRYDPQRANLATWLLALVRFRSIDLLRRAGTRAALVIGGEEAAERIASPERIDELAVARQESERTRHLVGDLPADQREVIELAYFGGYTQQEIAARVGVPLGTVKGRTRLGLMKLRHATAGDPVLARTA
jgi:RNA polymerase sigma-70 factor (ECF subfamily)